MKDLRIIFFGTPDFAVASLKAMVETGFNIVAVVTAIDKPAGRGHKMQSPPVKIYAESEKIPCLQPSNLKDAQFIQELKSFEANIQVVVAFRMLPEVVWNMPEHGTYNVHASLLPAYRGAAPINWAIINGEKTTGVTTFKLKHEIDTGNILLQREISIDEMDNAGSLHDKLMLAGANILIDSLALLSEGKAELQPQIRPTEAKVAPKIFKSDCAINWNLTVIDAHNFVRGMSPFPTAFAAINLPDGQTENWKIYQSKPSSIKSQNIGRWSVIDNELFVSCSDYLLQITELQSPGKRRMTADEFIRGLRLDLSMIS